ncbi:MAG: hypothetical protein U1G07_23110 [Verrucomicrobiota bacterium]
MSRIVFFLLLVMTLGLRAEERIIDFGKYPLDQSPAGFQSMLSGGGEAGEWKVIRPPGDLAGGKASAVLAQLSQDKTDERFPLMVLDDATYGDFTLTTRFRIVSGVVEQMAGIAFRIQDTNNYYYVRASALGGTFRFIKLVNGQRLTTLGPSVPIEREIWHELKVDCKGNRIACLLDGKELIPPLTDNTFTSGKIGFWTKSDSVSYFGETKITYTPHEILAQVLVSEALRKYPRLLNLKIFSLGNGATEPKVIASKHPDELGEAGGRIERDVIERDVMYYGREKKVALMTLPLHDRNGEVVGAARVVMQSFVGQTEQNAVARAQPIIKEMESRIRNRKDLFN